MQHLSSYSTIPELNEAFSEAIARVTSNINWLHQYSDDVSYWIKQELANGKETDGSSSTIVSTIIGLIIVITLGFVVAPVVLKYIRLKYKMRPYT